MPNARPSPRSVSTCGPRYPVTIQTLVTFASTTTRSRGHDRGCPDDDARDLSTRVAHAAQRLQLRAPAREDRIVRVRPHRPTRRRALRVPVRVQIPIPG